MSEEEHYHGGAICTVSRCGCPDDSASWPTTRTCPYCKRTASGYRHCPYCKRDYDGARATVWCTCGRGFITRQDRTAHWAHHPYADSGHRIPDSELCDSRAPDPVDERMQVQQQQQASAYRKRLMQREQALSTAELIRLDEQYPVWAHSYDTLAWGRQRCAYITGDDDALERMTSHVSEDSPAPWEPAPPAARPPMLIQTAWQDWRWLTAWQELEHPWKALLLFAVAYVLFIASIAIAVAVTG